MSADRLGGTVGPDGRPAVAWEPELPADEAARRVYTTYGRAAPDGTWRDLSTLGAAARARCRFFKVGVRMK